MDLSRWLQELLSDKGWYIERIQYLEKGYYAIIFYEDMRLKEVLGESPWHFRGGLVLVQPWEPYFSVDHGAYGQHLAWVELCNLPIHMWKFARSFFETIGKVISFNESQKYTFRPHARAYVLIDTNKEIPKKLVIKVGGRVEYEIKILILGPPNACFRCKQTRHFIRNFPYKPTTNKRNIVDNRKDLPRKKTRTKEEEGHKGEDKEEGDELVMMEEDQHVATCKEKEEAMESGITSGKQLAMVNQGNEVCISNVSRAQPINGEAKDTTLKEKENIPPKRMGRNKAEEGKRKAKR